MDVKKDIKLRVYIAFTLICGIGVAIIVKAALIQMNEGPTLRAQAREMRTRTKEIVAERGSIYAENGAILSSSTPQFDIHIDFRTIAPKLFTKHLDSLALGLSHIFNDETAEQYKQELRDAFKSQDGYYALKSNLNYYQYQQVKSLPIFRLGANKGGFIEDPKIKRLNPYGMLAYRTLGMYRENSPAIGLEASYDTALKGINGSRLEQKLSGSTWLPVDGSEVEATDGKDLVSTLDISVQDVAEHALKSVLQQYECAYGTCIVMEVETGKLRALVNLGRQKDGSYWEDLNYALIPTEPGSTFKLATLIALLNNKCLTINDMADDNGGVAEFGEHKMRDAHAGVGRMPVWEAFAHSSNVAFAKMAEKYFSAHPDRFVNSLRDLGLDKVSGIDLNGERKPYIKNPGDKNWSNTTLPWMATGYEVLISPLQTCMLYNAVANNGTMMKPYLVSSIREYGREVKHVNPVVLKQKIAEPEVVKQLQACTRAVVAQGTANVIESPYYQISGKTGTAQVADKGISYANGVYQGSFVGYFPSNKPAYTICVVIRTKPNSTEYYGAAIAAPVFRMVADKLFVSHVGSWTGQVDSIARKAVCKNINGTTTAYYTKYLVRAANRTMKEQQVHPGYLTGISIDSTKHMAVKVRELPKGLVPNVTGMSLRDAVYLLENQGLNVQVMGSGKVMKQSVEPGSRLIKGQNIVLQLS